MSVYGAVAVVLGAVLDALVAEPPVAGHPVAWLGRVVAPLDREWRHPVVVGVLVAVVVPVAAAAPVAGVVAVASGVSPWLGAVLAGVVVFVTTSRRMLVDLARDVVAASADDLAGARVGLRGLAGRDAGDLSAGQVRSAAVESVAENLADGLVAPLLAFTLGAGAGLPVAAGAAAWVKAVNTIDSMLGYETKPHGTAGARLDDLVMWVPARASAVLLAAASGRFGALGDARRWADVPSSPNSGWPMATMTAILEVRLEKPGAYVLRPDGALPSVPAARHGVAVASRAGWLAFLLAAAGVVAWP